MANEDVVDFGPDHQRSRLNLHVAWRSRRLALVAGGVGAAAAVLSLLGKWYEAKLSFPDESPREQVYQFSGDVLSIGAIGGVYLILVAAQLAVIALAMFGRESVRPHARLIGLATGGVAVAVMVAVFYKINSVVMVALGFALYGSTDEVRNRLAISTKEGAWAALAAVALLTLSTLLVEGEDVAAPYVVSEEEEVDHPTDHGMELTVSGVPTQASPPTEDELDMYKRPG